MISSTFAQVYFFLESRLSFLTKLKRQEITRRGWRLWKWWLSWEEDIVREDLVLEIWEKMIVQDCSRCAITRKWNFVMTFIYTHKVWKIIFFLPFFGETSQQNAQKKTRIEVTKANLMSKSCTPGTQMFDSGFQICFTILKKSTALTKQPREIFLTISLKWITMEPI